MRLLTFNDLTATIDRLNGLAEGLDVDLALVGGCAVLALAGGGEATRDVDALRTDSLLALERKLGESAWTALCQELELNTRSDMFLAHLPQDWEQRAILHPRLSKGSIRLFTPSAEDLAVMKLFRLNSKDAADIKTLAGLPGFDPSLLRRLFVSVLPFALGDQVWHAQSFEMAWNGLYPAQPISRDQILAEAASHNGRG